ncbi:PREDICTED: helicase-like transcription factor CHR28 isoform X1 [Camelina sativa]|uniref:Helicase-like transcription factor CHR28 isoform X1 n=2 Tax=Camelina sativa TaxID=90675 RepID=A0ABM0XL17_CAMSA|nr:PREDICTED: helicase-like transcription factor CHR28 isoform X1 [Camelina sativa]
MDTAMENYSSGSDEEVKEGETTVNEREIYQAALQDLKQPKTEKDLPHGVLTVPLMRHQKIALEWMRKKEKRSRNCRGGILADDQGLGKTISTISLVLLHKLKLQSKQKKRKGRKSGGTLIVCPASVVKQWAREVKEKVSDEHKLSVLIYHGSNRTKDPIELAKYDVVVTTYAIVTNEVPQNPLLGLFDTFSKKRDRASFEGSNLQPPAGALGRVRWLRVVLDEAHTIKNHRTLVAKACFSLRAKRRWCLTGTPIQNKVDDLYSYFRFLRYHPYAMCLSFRQRIKVPISKNSLRGYKKLQAVLRGIMLRRTKGTLLDGQPIIILPPKQVNLSKVDFSVVEWSFYRKLEMYSRLQYQEYADEGTLHEHMAHLLVMLLRLRQACNHPQLVNGYSHSDAIEEIPDVGHESDREYLTILLNLLKSSFSICNVCNDPPKDPVVTLCGHVFCYECVSENINGDHKTCPALNCSTELKHDNVFTESAIRSCINDYDDPKDKKVLFSLQGEFISSKIKAVIEILQSLPKQGSDPDSPPIKTIVFSQWTGMLDLVEQSFVKNRIKFRRLDGSMSLLTRDIAVKEFNNDPDVEVMLMSLKAGNLGLNMIAACHVILLDLWWNPTTEDQAIDRAHRIGQTRTVTVTRIAIKNTVEERILTLQERKRKIVASALGEKHGKSSAIQLTLEDLEYLFFGE